MAKTRLVKRNPQDATRRNVRAAKARSEKLAVRVARIERVLDLLFSGWRKQ